MSVAAILHRAGFRPQSPQPVPKAGGTETLVSQGVPKVPKVPAKNDKDKLRAHLLALAEFECLEPALVDRLDDADVMACEGESDATLTAYIRALDAAARMDAGMPPTGWTAARYCRLCGPVLLWPDCPPIVLACPWCFRRKAGRYVPRPQVQCADCVHFIRNALNPVGGGGECSKGRGGHWPKQRHRCDGFTPLETSR